MQITMMATAARITRIENIALSLVENYLVALVRVSNPTVHSLIEHACRVLTLI